MTHPPAAPNYIEQQAGSLQSGDHLLLPDGNRSAEIQRVEVETDDFGTPAMVLATLTGGGGLRIAAASTVLILEAAAGAGELPAEDAGSPCSSSNRTRMRAAEACRTGTARTTAPLPPPSSLPFRPFRPW